MVVLSERRCLRCRGTSSTQPCHPEPEYPPDSPVQPHWFSENDRFEDMLFSLQNRVVELEDRLEVNRLRGIPEKDIKKSSKKSTKRNVRKGGIPI